MKISGKHDVDVPLAFVAQILCDSQGWERAALRRGIEVRRTDRLATVGQGSTWTAQFRYRGKPRAIDLRIVDVDSDGRITVAFRGNSAEGTAVVMPLSMSARRTRIMATLDIQARTLAARLLFQSLRLARHRVVQRFERRLAKLGAEIEARHAASRG